MQTLRTWANAILCSICRPIIYLTLIIFRSRTWIAHTEQYIAGSSISLCSPFSMYNTYISMWIFDLLQIFGVLTALIAPLGCLLKCLYKQQEQEQERKREREKKSSGKRVILLEWCISSDFTNTNACRLLQFDSPISLNHRNSFCLSAVCEMNLKIISINCQHIYSGLVSCDIETRYHTMRCVVMQISLMCFLPSLFALIETRRISRRIQRNVNSTNFHPYIWYIFSIKAA